MSPEAAFPVLIASDGSPQARLAVEVAVAFPWPPRSSASGVVVRPPMPGFLPRAHREALDSSLGAVVEETRKALAARWPRAGVSLVTGAPANAIVAEARRRRARVIVVGAHGHGAISRLVIGSVSRNVVRSARCSVLIVRGAPGRIKNVVVGVDGSAEARRAVDLVARLAPERDARATVVRVVEAVRLASLGLLPERARAVLSGEAAALHARHLGQARRELEAATSRLGARWRPTGTVRSGPPVRELLRAAREAQADLIVIGARGSGGIERLLLGSVADAVTERSAVSVLIAR